MEHFQIGLGRCQVKTQDIGHEAPELALLAIVLGYFWGHSTVYVLLQVINNSLSLFTMYLYWLIEATLFVQTRVLSVYFR